MTLATASPRVGNIRRSLVGLKMPCALEMLDAALRRIEQGQIDGIEALDELLLEELSLRENRRIKVALRMARLPVMKTLAGFDFAFQPSLDRNRIMALAGLDFIARAEVVHLLGPPGTGKSHIATALAVEAVRAGKLVYFIPLADLVAQLAKAEREGTLLERIRFLSRASLLVVDEIGYLPVTSRRRQPVLPAGQRPLREGRDDPDIKLRISLIVGARFARWWAPISRDRGQFGA